MTAQLEDFGGDRAIMDYFEVHFVENDSYTICGTCGEDWLTGGCTCLMDYMTGKVDRINELAKEINQEA